MSCRWALAAALALVASGCGRRPCTRHSDCASDQQCSAAGTCGVTEDAGLLEADDAGPRAGPDAPPADAATDAPVDANPDAGSP